MSEGGVPRLSAMARLRRSQGQGGNWNAEIWRAWTAATMQTCKDIRSTAACTSNVRRKLGPCPPWFSGCQAAHKPASSRHTFRLAPALGILGYDIVAFSRQSSRKDQKLAP